MQNRYLQKSAGEAEKTYSFYPDPNLGNLTVHWFIVLVDGNGVDQKEWVFDRGTTGLPWTGLLVKYMEQTASGAILRDDSMQWTLDANGTPYMASTNTTLDENTSNAVTMRTEQTVDAHGNVVQTKVYDYAAGGNPGALLRTTTNGYLTSSNYTSRYIFNRLTETWAANGSGQAARVVSNFYDQYTIMPDTPGVRQHDSAYTAATIYRGNITSQTTPTGTVIHGYDVTGNTTTVQSGTGSRAAFRYLGHQLLRALHGDAEQQQQPELQLPVQRGDGADFGGDAQRGDGQRYLRYAGPAADDDIRIRRRNHLPLQLQRHGFDRDGDHGGRQRHALGAQHHGRAGADDQGGEGHRSDQ